MILHSPSTVQMYSWVNQGYVQNAMQSKLANRQMQQIHATKEQTRKITLRCFNASGYMYSWYTYTYTSAHFISDSERVNVVLSVCALLIKILLETHCQPCQTFLLDRETNKNKTKEQESIHKTQHTG